jgi:hypothetical protein
MRHAIGQPAIAELVAIGGTTRWYVGAHGVESGNAEALFGPSLKALEIDIGVRERPALIANALVRRAGSMVVGARFRGTIEAMKADLDALQ